MKDSILLKTISLPFSGRTNTKLGTKKRTIYIVSTGRTGTKFLADYFNNFSDVYAAHEPKPSRILRMWTNARLEKRANKSTMSRIFISKRKGSFRRIQEPTYVESNPFAAGFTDIMPAVLDNPEIIHVVRDPRTYIRSSLNHGNTHGIKKLLNNHLPFWYPDIANIINAKHKLSDKEKTAHYWVLINEFIEKCRKSIPDERYHFFKYEELFKNKESLKQISKIVGSKEKQVYTIKPINKSKDQVISDWNDWSKNECRSIDKICGKLMKQYGYGNEKSWLKKLDYPS